MEFYTAGDMVYFVHEGMLLEMDFATGTFASMPERYCRINWQRNARKIGRATFKRYAGKFSKLNPLFRNFVFKFDT